MDKEIKKTLENNIQSGLKNATQIFTMEDFRKLSMGLDAQISTLEGKVNRIVAIDIPITDSGAYYTGTEVETALQEIGAGTTLDGKYVNVTGDTMTGFLTLNADPTASLHAATKGYVDLAVGFQFDYFLNDTSVFSSPRCSSTLRTSHLVWYFQNREVAHRSHKIALEVALDIQDQTCLEILPCHLEYIPFPLRYI